MSNIIQSLWIGDKLSTMERLCISSYIHHGHEFHLYTYNDIVGLPKNCIVKDASEILPKDQIFSYNAGLGKGSYSAFSNYFRYKLLEIKGNWWTDTDMVCLKPISIKDDFVFASEKTADGNIHITSGIIKATPDSEFSKYCYEFCLIFHLSCAACTILFALLPFFHSPTLTVLARSILYILKKDLYIFRCESSIAFNELYLS